MRLLRLAILAGLGALAPPSLVAQVSPPPPQTAVVSGTVRNGATNAPVRTAAIRLAGGSASTLSDDAGRFHLELPLGEHRLEARRLGYRPATVTVVVAVGGTVVDVKMEPIAVALDRMLITARDDAARRIITSAIRRKQQLRGSMHDYRFDGDVRMVAINLAKPADSASSIVAITETRTTAYWEPPNLYQETIVARRQTGNLTAEQNLVGVGRILDFGSDRVQFGRFELASPIADDALDRYDYRMLDTLAIDGRRVFRLSLEPKPDGTPAFAGIIDIADSTFDVTGIDLGVNNAVRLGVISNVRYQMRYGDVGGGRWMPRTIEITIDLRLPIVATAFRIQRVAQLSDFRFDKGIRPAGLGEYRIVVADSADRADSTLFSRPSAIPLSPLEKSAWTRIDSVAREGKVAGRAFAALLLTITGRYPDFFQFNRVDGAYVGAGWTWFNPAAMPGTVPTLKLGYADASKLWQYRAGDRVRLSESRRVWIGAVYHDETVSRPTFTSAGYNATGRALFRPIDPLDYYRERGLVASFTTKLVDFAQLDAGYTDARQMSLPLAVSRPLLRGAGGRLWRPNEPIDDGHMRSLSAAITYDSRPMLRQAGRDLRLARLQWTRIVVEAEVSPGRALASDFDYRRYSMRVDRRQQTLGLGVTSFVAMGGIGSAGVPVQRFFRVDGGARLLEALTPPFGTLQDSNFTAPRAAMIAVVHDFDRLLFTRSRLPLVRDIPFTLAVRGAVFWTDFAGPTSRSVARSPFREVGVNVGNLTPFMSPFNAVARFAWQLSSYPTTRFRFSLGFGQ